MCTPRPEHIFRRLVLIDLAVEPPSIIILRSEGLMNGIIYLVGLVVVVLAVLSFFGLR